VSFDSHVRRPAFHSNANTEVLTGHRRGTPDLRQAYTFARGIARMLPDALGGRPGHSFFWVRGASFASSHLLSHVDAFSVVGRHTQCGVVLRDDPFVALRQLLVRSIALPSGGVALRVLDLHTALGFTLTDGSRQTSIFAEGPVAVGVGEYALVALPTETREDQLPDDLPLPEVAMPAGVRDQIAAMENAMSPYRVNGRRERNRSSRITLMPRLVMMGEPLPPRLGRLATGGSWGVTLERDGRSATLSLSEEDLAGGVLIGRSEKCHAETLRRITDHNTSRVHVLVLREGEHVVAYDLASTQGTYVNGQPARRVQLSEAGTLLLLGRGDRAVRMFWHRSAT
jgi:FHA domain